MISSLSDKSFKENRSLVNMKQNHSVFLAKKFLHFGNQLQDVSGSYRGKQALLICNEIIMHLPNQSYDFYSF